MMVKTKKLRKATVRVEPVKAEKVKKKVSAKSRPSEKPAGEESSKDA